MIKNNKMTDTNDGNGVPEVLCYAKSLKVGSTAVVPKKRAYLRLPCPGASFYVSSRPLCSKAAKTWHCTKCHSMFMYGFDDAFHCSCGSAPCWSFQFMCNDTNHGLVYLAVSSPSFSSRSKFTETLQCLLPLPELNILVLGETGVGKSTWINSFVNYLTYNTMEEAECSGLRYLIGSSFTMVNEEFQSVEIKMGTAENENNSKGQSCTQMPNSYVFCAGDFLVRLIDTPGVGDTRGMVQDKVNFLHVLSHLSNLEDIHGICILLKSNSARLTITFQFCIKELLTHLHKDACKNIVFIFTNARETFYKPGDTYATLRNLLTENKDIEIELGKETIYCMDNEAVRFLAASEQDVKFSSSDRINYSISWNKSVDENKRLVKHIQSLTSHSTRKTLSLNEARRLILGLTEPLAQISQNIQNNITLAKNRRDEVNNMIKNSGDLKGKLYIPVMDIEAKKIPYPRTVCTSSKCTDYININGITKVKFKTWCHEHCYLSDVQVDKYPCPELQNCTAMNNAATCTVCGCTWEVHMHVIYECVEVMTTTVDNNIEEQLRNENDSISKAEEFINDVEQRIACLNREQEVINKVASKCGSFLKQNAITPYNDSVDEYLKQCIRIQKDQVNLGASDNTLKGLEKIRASYSQEVKILEMTIKDATDGPWIGPEDIPRLIGELYELPINGETLKEFADVSMNAKLSMAVSQEKVYEPPSCLAVSEEDVYDSPSFQGSQERAHDPSSHQKTIWSISGIWNKLFNYSGSNTS